ncbi:nucleotide-binding universal stress UspA family protein [Pedobacter africanus]|uniref:Nucleotide-binding universal stress UspA family protein n=1 Tax=Pedobacter africanus TaxID=151894 RepID=A0ACC6KU70_9SPHI|nr:universal stress protein [Pedobacter africanus]MDR6782781.1 nucleotide-binding universal stress UspA family protein [Pedobacter africanus]
MKKILMPTDFSVPAENAAHYALQLAKVLKADVILCNAYRVPAEAPMAAQVAWPLVDSSQIAQEVSGNLDNMVRELSAGACTTEAGEYCPELTYESAKGSVCEVVSALVKKRKIDLVVMGMAGAGSVTQLVLGSNTREMIDKADFPLLLVPYEAAFKKIRKIVFVTDLDEDELEAVTELTHFAASLNAQIVIVHITSRAVKLEGKLHKEMEEFFQSICSRVDYPAIKYEYVWNIDVDNGLDWLAEQKDVDIIAMAHHAHNLLYKLFIGSHTHKLSRHTKIPLLVFPFAH